MKDWEKGIGSFDCNGCHTGYMGYKKEIVSPDTVKIICKQCGYSQYINKDIEKKISKLNN